MTAFTVFGCSQEQAPPEDTNLPDQVEEQEETAYTTGTYTAIAKGHNSDFNVEVTFSDSAITDIVINENDETGYMGEASMNFVKDQILTHQTVKVDTVSGATVSSGALLSAVRDAVKQAGGDINAMTEAIVSEETWSDTTTQVVVVGSGSAGLAATMEAHGLGLDVILVEQLGIIGGSSGRAGYIMGGGTQLQKENDIDYTTEDFVAYMTNLGATGTGGGNRSEIDPGLYQEETAKLVGTMAGENVDWLQSLGVKFRVGNENQFRGDGSRLGPFMMKAMLESMDTFGIDYRLNTRAEEIIMKDGNVAGVKVVAPDGSSYNINADAVVMATGSYNANNDMVKKFNPKYDGYPYDVSKGSDGSGMLMVEDAGGVLKYMNQANYHSFATVWRGASRNMASTINSGAVAVNKEGNRFVNEGTYYDESCCDAILSQTGGVCYVIFDQSVADTVIVPGDNHLANNIDMYQVADTIEELAAKLGIDEKELVKTVENYKSYVETGEDQEFGRPATSMKATFQQGPFYGCEALPELHTVHGGVVVDINSRAIDEQGNAIQGLYTVGEASASHVLGSTTNTVCVVQGRVAARDIKSWIED